jgi:hypothetical protein
MLQKLLSNPNVLAAVKAAEEGREVEVVERKAVEKPKGPVLPEGKDVEDLSNRELVEFISSVVGSKVEEIVNTKLSAVEKSLGGVRGFMAQSAQEKVNAEVAAARKNFSDFDTHAKAIVELSQKVQGLSVEELYFLAKQRADVTRESGANVASEKPSSVRGPATSASTPKSEVKTSLRGRAGFSDLLGKAVEKIDFTK